MIARRRSPTGVRPSRSQLAASRATNSTRSGTGSYATSEHCVDASKRASPLKETARERMRPSTSGSATFMAMSRAERPRVPARQLFSSPPENTTCSTGAPVAASGESTVGLPGVETANPVPLSTSPAPLSASSVSTTPAETGSFRLVQYSGRQSTPFRRSASTSARTGATLSACTSAR